MTALPRHRHQHRALATVARATAKTMRDEGDARAPIAFAIAADWTIIAGRLMERGIRDRGARASLLEQLSAAYWEEAAGLRARLSERAGKYLDRYGADAVIGDLADGFRLEPRLRSWARATQFAELTETLLWWERGHPLGTTILADAAERRLHLAEAA